MSIAEKLVTIAENEQKVFDAGQLKTLQDSEYMNANITDTVIAVNDVSPIEHSVGVQLSSKNLALAEDVCKDFPQYTLVEFEGRKAIRYLDNKTVIWSGIPFKTNTQYTVSFDARITKMEETERNSSLIYFFYSDGTRTSVSSLRNETWEKFSLTSTAGKTVVGLGMAEHDYTNFIYMDCDSFQLELGTTITPYTPFVEKLGGIEVSRYGKNLLNFSIAYWYDGDVNKSYYENGILYVDTGSGNSLGVYTDKIYLPTNTPLCYKHKIADASGDRVIIRCFDKNDNNISANINIGWGSYLAYYEGHFGTGANGAKFTLPPEVSYIVLVYCRMNNTDLTTQNEYSDIQIEVGTATTYEPYIEPITYTSSADGTVDGIRSLYPSMTLLTNNNGVVINANYLRDIDTYIDNLITNVALTGGE